MSNNQKLNPQGYNYTTPPYNTNPSLGEYGDLPIASETKLGGIKVGKNLTIEEDGTLNAQAGGGGGTGEKGDKGDPGFSPIADVSSTGSTESGALAATITITDETGTTSAKVYNGQKGERGPAGSDGAPGKDGETGPAGPAGKDGTSPTVSATGSTTSGALAGTISDGTNTISVYNGTQGPEGPQGPPGTATGADLSQVVNNVSLTNENGVYSLKQAKGDPSAPVETEVGAIEVPNTDNLLAEVKDSVVSNNTAGYDFHTVQETENNGTVNDIAKVYLAKKQITDASISGHEITLKTVDQEGLEESKQLEIPLATNTDAGVVKIGDSLIIDENGLINTRGPYYRVLSIPNISFTVTAPVSSANVPALILCSSPVELYTGRLYGPIVIIDYNLNIKTGDGDFATTYSPIIHIKQGDVAHDTTIYLLGFVGSFTNPAGAELFTIDGKMQVQIIL